MWTVLLLRKFTDNQENGRQRLPQVTTEIDLPPPPPPPQIPMYVSIPGGCSQGNYMVICTHDLHRHTWCVDCLPCTLFLDAGLGPSTVPIRSTWDTAVTEQNDPIPPKKHLNQVYQGPPGGSEMYPQCVYDKREMCGTQIKYLTRN